MYRVRRPKVQEEPSVFRHWYRVCGTDYLRLAKAYGQQGVGAGMQRLGPSNMNAVQPVVRYLETALALLRQNPTWKLAVDALFTSLSYSHLMQSASVGALDYASPQQLSVVTRCAELLVGEYCGGRVSAGFA